MRNILFAACLALASGGAMAQTNPPDPVPPADQVAVSEQAPDHIDVFFAPGSVAIEPGQMATLMRVAGLYSKFKPKTMVLTGHADGTGDPLLNTNLSVSRAQAVLRVLFGTGVLRKDGWEVFGLGANDPVGADDAANRVVRVTWK